MSMVWNTAQVLLGLVLLVLAAEWMVRGAASLAKRLHVREIVIGLTVVAFGTSMPEMVVNLFASADGRQDIVFGNVVGSNIFNLMFILGVAGLIYPLTVQGNTTWKEIPFSLLVTLVLYLLVNERLENPAVSNTLSRSDAGVLLLLFIIFLAYAMSISKSPGGDVLGQEVSVKIYSMPWSLLLLVVGLGGLVAGGKLCVDGSVALARHLGLSEKFIGCTIISAGTSLPELATSAVAAYRRRCDLAVGNVVGSNIFNILCILGVSGLVRPAPYNELFNIDIYMLAAGTVLLFAVMFTGKRHTLNRLEAVVLLAGYAGYVYWLLQTSRPG